MCGLSGVISQEATAENARLVRELSARLRHRGPDEDGFWVSGPDGSGLAEGHELTEPISVGLAHRRLSVVDIAEGHQPMSNEDGTVWITFNGEIYNHLTMRRTLQSRGHVFRTRSDTEVLVHGWEEWGERLFGKLNGIFAIALFDQRREQLVLARDPLGVKPLYFGVGNKMTWWASELAAATAAGLADGPLSLDALRLFLTFRFIPSPWCVLERAWKLPAGHFVRVPRRAADESPSVQPYRCEIRCASAPRTRDDWQEALLAGVQAAVARQLMADVPVAALLSGGVDSTLVSQLMRNSLPYIPHTYGIGFPSDGALNEALAAANAAKVLGTAHHSVLVEDEDYLARWPAMFGYVGEPVANLGGLLVQLLCEQAAHEHKVVLTGQGADEPLGGYPRHVAERMYPAARHLPRAVRSLAPRLIGADASARLVRTLQAPTQIDRYLDLLSVFAPEQVDRLVPSGRAPARELARAAIGRWVSDEDAPDSLNQLLRLDTRLSLADDLLLIADHFSMRSSVELRVPFLDLEFLELVERMPSRYKVSWLGARKWLYRRGALKILPQAVPSATTARRARFGRKRGFNAPVSGWFSAGGPIGADDLWLEGLIDRCPELAPDVARQLAADPDDGQNARRRVTLYALSQWLAHGPLRERHGPTSTLCDGPGRAAR